MEPGGQLTTTTEVDNFPGYPKGVDGPSMMVDLQQQAERFGTKVNIGMATAVELSKERGGIPSHRLAAVDGAEIMKTFDVGPCREIGLIKDHIKEAILEGVIPNEYEAAYAMMLEKAASKSWGIPYLDFWHEPKWLCGRDSQR